MEPVRLARRGTLVNRENTKILASQLILATLNPPVFLVNHGSLEILKTPEILVNPTKKATVQCQSGAKYPQKAKAVIIKSFLVIVT